MNNEERCDNLLLVNFEQEIILDMFEGFTKETSDFLWDLTFNNERSWFLEHKAQFESCLKKPLDALAKDTQTLMDEKFSKYSWNVHISRIYRDARRLFGRGPYKERMWFTLRPFEAGSEAPCLYFEIGAAGYRCGMGFHEAKSADMAAFRKAVDANPAQFERLSQKLLKLNKYTVKGEEYKRIKGDKGEVINKFYNRKWLSLECSKDFGGDVLRPEFPKVLTEGFSQLMPFYEFVLKAYMSDRES